MKDQEKKEIESCFDVKNKDGQVFGAVCVATGKDLGKKDIILMEKENNAYSVRSITELMNKLAKKNVSFEERKKILDFASKRLRSLESNEKSSELKIGPFEANKSEKLSIDKIQQNKRE